MEAYAHFDTLLLIIFRAHRRNTHPVVPTGLSLTLLACRTRHLMSSTHFHIYTHRKMEKKKRNRKL